MNTLTPETDDNLCYCGTLVSAEFARKMEVERNATQRVSREQHAQIIGLYAQEAELRNERDQLRQICDELTRIYNNLPPVKK